MIKGLYEPLDHFQSSSFTFSIIIGGGKTHVAAYVTKYHHEKAKALSQKFLALFLVPIRLLAEQQGNIFEGDL